MCNPLATTGSHHRFERGDEAAGGDLQLNGATICIVDVGFSVRDGDDLGSRQTLTKQSVKGLRRPLNLDAVAVFAVRPKLAQQRPHLRIDRQSTCTSSSRFNPTTSIID